ncbi:Bacterial alpha-L-rhamnosidase [Cesiribacter andamanensis AMV16]|uniref:Bacterial alpha-L-rhamnosidase n=2 Tax=Cesiribacter TaxID=1133570 RepID=M7NYP3_9BACT|nr:Bacterial alpha-L-rhamnosidase [Cesiribacter andamanensis AMV16]
MLHFCLPVVAGLTACTQLGMESAQAPSDQLLYQSETFAVYADRVTQNLYEAAALSPTALISNYQSPANDQFSRGIDFKFSLNGKDNELPVGVNHFLVLYPEGDEGIVSPLITFGQTYTDTRPVPADDFLEQNVRFRIRLDMRPVLEAFARQGYYQDYRGERIYQSDFRGVYVAGNAEPLSWDFENLPSREGMQLQDPDGDGIYETTLVLNPYNPENFTANRWELTEDISAYPQYRSSQLLVDALYAMSLEEMKLDVRPDQTFMAGEKWNGVWTRDISYSIVLALAAIEPQISKNSLMAKVKDGRIIQDTGTGGSWPVSTDRTTWALAAWEVYAVTGDQQWLRQAYDIIKKSAEEDLQVAFNEQTGLFKGESSFLDWRKQSYPQWMGPVPIYLSETLGTNVVHYETYQILGRMAQLLGEPAERWQQVAQRVKQGLNKHLWQPDRGFYGQYLYGNAYLALSPRAEALGEALAVLYGVADAGQVQQVISRTPMTAFGATSIYPQIPNVPPYHNEGIWPFVQAYWNWAAARAGNEQALLHGLAATYRSAALFLTNKENFVASTGDFNGTEINSDRQLWSVAGNLAMVYRVFFGMQFEPGGIRFSPSVPEVYGGQRSLTNFRYRNAVLQLELSGWGNQIEQMELDGRVLDEPFIPADLQGEHRVLIRLSNSPYPQKPYAVVDNHFSLPAPEVQFTQQALRWQPVAGAVQYQIWQNGSLAAESADTQYPLGNGLAAYAEYMVAAVDEAGWPSFFSEPVQVVDPARVQLIEAEQLAPAASLQYEGYSGKGFVELSRQQNTHISFRVQVPQAGEYLLDVRFSNGSGPVNTDNKAAIRSLYVGEAYAGPVVMPQLGTEEWSNWGRSNPLRLQLQQGENQLQLRFMPWNENMNSEVNRAMLDQIRLIRL